MGIQLRYAKLLLRTPASLERSVDIEPSKLTDLHTACPSVYLHAIPQTSAASISELADQQTLNSSSNQKPTWQIQLVQAPDKRWLKKV